MRIAALACATIGLMPVVNIVIAAPNCGTLQLPIRWDDPVLRWHPYLQNVTTSAATVRWATRTFDAGQVVFWKPGAQSSTVASSAKTLADATTGIGFDLQFHDARLAGLDADTDYCYRVEHGGTVIASGLYLRTAWGTTRPEARFLVFGDSGGFYSTPWRVREAFTAMDGSGDPLFPADFWLGLGDLAYSNGTYSDYDLYYFRSMQGRYEYSNNLDTTTTFLWRTPTYHAVGNHEYANGASDAETYRDLFEFPVPTGIPAGDAERYYSFDYGNVHVVSIDGNKFGGIDSSYPAMLNWLAADLAASNAFWKVVISHQGPFSHGNHGAYGDVGQWKLIRTYMLPILQQYGVNIMFSGHDHLYQRNKPMKVDNNGKIFRTGGPAASGQVLTPIIEYNDGIVYVVAGNGGTSLHPRQADPAEPDGIITVGWQGEGYDFVAKRANGDPILYTRASDGYAPTFPQIRHGFTYVVVNDCRMTVRSITQEKLELDRFDINRCDPDFNEDTRVDSLDLGVLMSRWGSGNPAADLNGNGVVDSADLQILLLNWSP